MIEIMVFLIAVTLEKQKKNYFQNLFLLKRFLFQGSLNIFRKFFANKLLHHILSIELAF